VHNYDTDPDIFTYSFPGKSGNFFFDGQSNFRIIKIPYSPVKIVKYYSPDALAFDITDEQGNLYRFGQNLLIERATNSQETTTSTTSWMLNEVISQSGKDTISFSYTSESYYLPAYDIDKIDFIDLVHNFDCNRYQDVNSSNSYSFHSFITDQKPSEIDYNGGKVVFVKSTANRQDFDSKKLDTIKVYNYNYAANTYNLLKKIVFHTSYFTNTRLRLDSLSLMDKNGVTVERYRFNYNTSVDLPAVNTKGQDYWGYFNGRTYSNSSLVPETVILYENGNGGSSYVTLSSGNHRDCDTAFMQANMLTRIYYPTGGYTDFEYQTNRYKDDLGQTNFAGGLRIKSIKSYESAGSTPVTRTYSYGPGRANFTLSNYYFVTTQNHRFYSDCGYLHGPGEVATMRERVYNSFPSIDLVPFDGSIVVYPRVTEYVGNSTTNSGMTVYKYRDHTDAMNSTMGVVTSRSPIIDSYSDQRGQLTEKADYKNVNGTYFPVSRETYAYNTSAFADTSFSWVGFCCDKHMITDTDGSSDVYLGPDGQVNDAESYLYTFYRVRSDDNYLTSKTIKTYDQNDTTKYVTQTTTYSFGNPIHQQVESSSTTDSKGQSKNVYFRYPADYSATGGFIISMQDRNMQAVPIEQYTKISGNTVAGQLNAFKTGSLSAIVPDYVKILELSAPVTNFTPSTASGSTLVNDSRYSTYVTFESYDGSNNLTKYSPRTSGPVSILWAYRSLYPVAKIVNSNNTNYAYTGFESRSEGGGWTYSATPVTSIIPKAGKGCYCLCNGNIYKTISTTGNYRLQYWARANVSLSGGTITDITTSSADADGWIFFEKDVNVTSVNTTLYISGSDYIDELRLFPANSQITTFTYEPGLGISSQNDENGVATYYEFDDYGRLKFIRNQDKNVLQNYDYHFKKSY
jgi:hypothetical protein